MRPWIGYLFFVGVFVLSLTNIVPHADWGEPITVNDLFLMTLTLAGILIIEVRYAARWVVNQIKGN